MELFLQGAPEGTTSSNFRYVAFLFDSISQICNTSTFKRSKDERYFKASFQRFSRSVAGSGDYRFELSWAQRMPILHEDTGTTGFDAHYVYHTSWAARLLSQNHPALHQDFASDIRFATLVSAFIPMVFYDYRPLLVELGPSFREGGSAEPANRIGKRAFPVLHACGRAYWAW